MNREQKETKETGRPKDKSTARETDNRESELAKWQSVSWHRSTAEEVSTRVGGQQDSEGIKDRSNQETGRGHVFRKFTTHIRVSL